MPVQWVVAPHEPTLELLESSLRDSAGAMLVGSVGAGKTELARAAQRRASQPSTHWVTGTAPLRVIPFGAFGELIDVGAGKAAELLRAARGTLGRGALIIVDDAHRLDALSAGLVYQLAVSGSARLIVTVDPAERAPAAIAALRDDALLPCIDVAALDLAAVAALLEAVVDGPVGAAAVRDLHRISGGNPLHLRHVLQHGWPIDDPGSAPPLSVLMQMSLAALPATVRSVLEHLAFGDPMTLADISALTGGDAVEQAVGLGVVRVSDAHAPTARGQAGIVRPEHPLYTDTVHAALGPADARRLRTALAAQIATAPAPDVLGRLRLAVLALDSDAPQPVADVVTAAEEALRLGDLELSERLGRGALDRDGGLRARVPLAYALAWQGRGRDSEAVLAAVDPAGLTESELLAWALPRAANQFWMLSEPERATAFLQTTRSRLATPAALNTVDALAGTFAMNAGSPQRASRICAGVLASPDADDTAVGWAASTAALCCARMGQFDRVDALADRALAAGHPGLLRFTSGFGQTTALVMAGDLDGAQTLAQRLTDFAELRQPGRAIGEMLIAQVLIDRGDCAGAVRLLRGAAAALAPTGYSWGPLALMYLAQALGQQGETAEAAKVASRAESRHGMKSALFAPELLLARAWTLAAPGRSGNGGGRSGNGGGRHDSHRAIAAAREAAQMAQRGGQSAIALRALHDAVRLGDIHAAAAISALVAQIDCVVGRLARDHGRALAAGDEAALSAVSAGFWAIGMTGAAKDAAAQAADARCVT